MIKPRTAGFTLLEMVIVMAIIALFVGSAATFVLQPSSKELIKVDNEIQTYIRETRLAAVNEQSAYYIHFRDNKLWRTRERFDETKRVSSMKIPADAAVIPEDASVEVLKDNKWIEVTDKKIVSWLFSRSGIAEPCSIRIDYEGASLERLYDPLTALPVNDEI